MKLDEKYFNLDDKNLSSMKLQIKILKWFLFALFLMWIVIFMTNVPEVPEFKEAPFLME